MDPTNRHVPDVKGWQAMVREFTRPHLPTSVWQIVNSFGGLLLTLTLMALALQVSVALTLLLAVPAAGFLVRIFIIQHDCGHGAFFHSKRANDFVGTISSLVTLAPYKFWRKAHAVHHAHHAELEERGIGDVWTLTVAEYAAAPWWKRAVYRVFRTPWFLFFVAAPINWVVLQRLPLGAQRSWRRDEKASVWWTNLALAVLAAVTGWLVGFGILAIIVVPVLILAASAGTWLFYVQHQFERTYWEHTPEWDYTLAALHGSSFYDLPRVLQWFTGNIGYHHIHHLSPRIPNYKLQRCHDANPELQRVSRLTLGSSLRTALLSLWDEQAQRLVTFREARSMRRAASPA